MNDPKACDLFRPCKHCGNGAVVGLEMWEIRNDENRIVSLGRRTVAKCNICGAKSSVLDFPHGVGLQHLAEKWNKFHGLPLLLPSARTN